MSENTNYDHRTAVRNLNQREIKEKPEVKSVAPEKQNQEKESDTKKDDKR